MKQNVFDRIIGLSILKIIRTFFKKYKEMILYLFFGGLSFLINIGIFAFFSIGLDMDELVSNALSWILTVSFVFFTNRLWVFKAPTKTWKDLKKQFLYFCVGRVFTLIIEEITLGLFIVLLHFDSMPVKCTAQFIVILLNYIFSRYLVFK